MRLPILLALAALAVSAAHAQVGTRDRYFLRYPFDRWQAEGDKAEIRWTVRVRPATLSVHQRLSARIEIEVDPKEIGKRRGRGEIATFIQIEDSAGKKWRIHDIFGMSRIPEDAKALALAWSQEAFLLPGEYKVSVAICDSQTGEHSFTRRDLHVPVLRADGLPDAWQGLPQVEFVYRREAPDGWFQPWTRGRVHVALQTARPVHIDLLMNLTPSERPGGSANAFRRNMSVLIPAMKILAAMDVPNGSTDITLLDLLRRGIFEQKDAHALDWTKTQAALADIRPGIVDVQALAIKSQMAQFFRDQVLLRAQPRPNSEELQVVIVLSAPAFLGEQTRLEPADLPRTPNRRIFYLRYRPPRPRPAPFSFTSGEAPPAVIALPPDDLEHVLKPLDARIFTVTTPEDFRKALAALLAEIRRM